jgi:hypothetical protein
MKKLLCVIAACCLATTMVDHVQAGGGGGGGGGGKNNGGGKNTNQATIRVRNTSNTEPVRVWLLTQEEVNSLTGDETRSQLRGRFGGGVNLTGGRNHDFRTRAGQYSIIAVHTAAYDNLVDSDRPLQLQNLGLATTNISVDTNTRQQFNITPLLAAGVRTTTIGGGTAF